MTADILHEYKKAVESGWCVVSSGSVFSALVDSVLYSLTKDEKYNLSKNKEQVAWSERVAGLAFDYVKSSGQFTDAFGVIAMEAHSKNGRSYNGQFFTPDVVANLAGKVAYTDLSYSRLGASRFDVLEPTCGTGAMVFGFLRAVKELTPDLLPNFHITGCELARSYALAFYANILLNEACHGHSGVQFTVLNGNTLSDDLDVLACVNHDDEVQPLRNTRFDIVIGNPPFGALNVDQDASWLRTAHKKPAYDALEFIPSDKLKKSAAGEELFIDLATSLLKPDGVMSFIIPDGVLSNSKAKPFRQFIMENFKYRATLSFPSTLFVQTGTTVKTSLMMIKNSGPMDAADNVFMAMCESVGWDSRGRTIKSELPEVEKALMAFLFECAVGDGASELPRTASAKSSDLPEVEPVIDVIPEVVDCHESEDALLDESIEQLIDAHIPANIPATIPTYSFSF